MKEALEKTRETQAAKAFSAQSTVFDTIYGNDPIVAYKRERVRAQVEKYLPAQSHILELNSGTGEDALYFASRGHKILATDLSAGMLQKLSEKIKLAGKEQQISTEQCSFTELESLENKGPYDLIFSNFAGLNCTGELDKVLQSFDALLKPGGMFTLAILPGFCLWETLLALRGDFKTAFRRFFAKNGAPASVEGNDFTCWYYHPNYIIRHLQDSFDLLDLEGLCTIVPPNYLSGFPQRFPRTFGAPRRSPRSPAAEDSSRRRDAGRAASPSRDRRPAGTRIDRSVAGSWPATQSLPAHAAILQSLAELRGWVFVWLGLVCRGLRGTNIPGQPGTRIGPPIVHGSLRDRL